MLDKIKENKFIIILLIFVVIGMFIISYSCLMSPDEYNYSHITWTSDKISSFSDIFKSLKILYLNWAGRIPVTALIQLILFLKIDIFYVVNPIIFIIFLIYIVKIVNLICKEKKSKCFQYSIILFLLLFTSVVFGEKFIWLSGSLNYLWPVTLMLIFIYEFKKNIYTENKLTKIKSIILFFISFFVGWSQENVAFITGAFILIYSIFNFKKFLLFSKSKKVNILINILFFGIGAILLLFAPGNFSRMNTSTGGIHLLNIIKNLYHIKYMILIYFISLIGVLILSVRSINLKSEVKSYIKHQIIYLLLPCFIGILPMIVIGEFPDRSMLPYEVFIIITILINTNIIFNYLKNNKNFSLLFKCIIILLSFVVIAKFVYLEYIGIKYINKYKLNMKKEILTEKELNINEVVVSEFENFEKIKYSIFPDYFPRTLDTEMVNYYMARFYNVEKINAVKSGDVLVDIKLSEEQEIKSYDIINIQDNQIVTTRIVNEANGIPEAHIKERIIYTIPKDKIGVYKLNLPQEIKKNIVDINVRDTSGKMQVSIEEIVE